nr:MAG TPA: hypothetical protein [Caudoviricetes sp.]
MDSHRISLTSKTMMAHIERRVNSRYHCLVRCFPNRNLNFLEISWSLSDSKYLNQEKSVVS